MFQERDYLKQCGFEIVDFSMSDERNMDSPTAKYFVGRKSYKSDSGIFSSIVDGMALIHSSEAVRNIGRLIDHERPDILHCHNIYHQLTPSIIGAAKKRGIPVVLTLHDYKIVCPTYLRLRDGKPCSDCLDSGPFNVLKKRCADHSIGKSALMYVEAVAQGLLRNYEMVDIFIAPSQFMADSVTQKRVPKEKVRVLYNGVDLPNQDGSLVDGGYILYLGRLSPEKGVLTLLSAHSEMAGCVDLVIAGIGHHDDELRQSYPRAKFIGHVSGTKLHDVLSGASVVVVPSEWYENCPMSVLEAMSYGKPVIGSNIGGLPELIVNGETGLLFEPGNKVELLDAMSELMNNSTRRQSMGMLARKRAEQKFSLSRHNKQLINIYQSLC